MRSAVYRATEPDTIRSLTDQIAKHVAGAWQIVDGGNYTILLGNRSKLQDKVHHNASLGKMLKAAMQKHKVGAELDQEIAAANNAVIGTFEDPDEQATGMKDLVAQNIEVLKDCCPGDLLKWTYESKSGPKERAVLYLRHSPELLYCKNVIGKDTERSWRLSVLEGLHAVNRATSSSASVGTAPTVTDVSFTGEIQEPAAKRSKVECMAAIAMQQRGQTEFYATKLQEIQGVETMEALMELGGTLTYDVHGIKYTFSDLADIDGFLES